ncbi:MAG TPA: hypothetical protein VF198_05610, partial [Vicinamibacterales bacterium]
AAAGDAQGRTLAGFAEDLGRLLGQTERKASEWLQQRQAVAEQLSAIRDKAIDLLGQLGLESGRASARATTRRAGRKTGRKRRRLSKETRMKMAEAARRRWAARKAAGK